MDYYDIQVRKTVERALEEDLGWGDVTTDSLIPDEAEAEGSVVTRCDGVVAGVEVMKTVFALVDPALEVRVMLADGEAMRPGDVIAIIKGRAASILRAERVALNFLQRMGGVATATSRYVAAVHGLPVRIADTRKTAPGLRILDKYAVRVGGGLNHRMHLGDGVLIKDNHLEVLRARGITLKEALASIRQNSPRILYVQVEADSVEEATEAAEAGADSILLDNMDAETMRRAAEAIAGRALIEASGGMTLENARAAAETGVDFISVGALTHSVQAMDIALELKAL